MESADTILVVDNDTARRKMLETWLVDGGYRLAIAIDGQEALIKAAEVEPDLILLAAPGPAKDGLDLCRRLRAAPLSTQAPIIMAAPLEERESRLRGLEAGVDDFVSKPFDRTELLARLRAFARLGRQRKHLDAELAEAEAEIVRCKRRLLALQSAGVAVTSGLELQQTLDTITRELADLLKMKVCILSQWSQESRTSGLLAIHDPEGWWNEKRAADYQLSDFATTKEALSQRRAQQVRISQPNIGAAELAYMQEAGITVMLKLPMIYQDRVVGLIEVIDDGSERELVEDEITLAQLLANEAASAVENARLYETIRRHVAEVTTLNKISQVITSILDLRETLAIIADHAHWLLGVAAASVILYDSESGDMWFGAASGEGSDFVRDKRLAEGKGIVNWVIQHGEPLIVADAAQDQRFFDQWDKEINFTTRSILCVPLQTKGQTIGAIEAINKAGGPFDQEDLTLLTSMAASAAIAIENARLYEQAQQEIAERKRIEEKLRDHADHLEDTVAERTHELQAERDRTQAILEALGEAVIVTDLAGSIQYVNPAAVALTGYTSEEVIGQSPRLWQHEPQAAAAYAGESDTPDPYQAQHSEVVSRHKDGTLYDTAMTIAPLFDSREEDRLVGHVCVQRDISPIKEAERLKDQFVSNVSHELRTPLSVITLVSGNLERLFDRLSDDRRRKMVRDIRGHAQVLNDLVGDVLELSRIESGSISMERQRVDLAELVREEAEKQLPLAEKKAQTLRATCGEELAVWGNRDQLRQVLRNLLNNAIKFTPDSGRITCECLKLVGEEVPEAEWPGNSSLPAGHWVATRIVDTGIGISAQDLPQLFERFYRVKTQGNIPGTGLGLSIAQELIELHGGQIVADSTLGEGSIFAIYLPLLEE